MLLPHAAAVLLPHTNMISLNDYNLPAYFIYMQRQVIIIQPIQFNAHAIFRCAILFIASAWTAHAILNYWSKKWINRRHLHRTYTVYSIHKHINMLYTLQTHCCKYDRDFDNGNAIERRDRCATREICKLYNITQNEIAYTSKVKGTCIWTTPRLKRTLYIDGK